MTIENWLYIIELLIIYYAKKMETKELANRTRHYTKSSLTKVGSGVIMHEIYNVGKPYEGKLHVQLNEGKMKVN